MVFAVILPSMKRVFMGEQSAADLNPGNRFTQSDPVLRPPTSLATAGRKPEARPPAHFHLPKVADLQSREAGLPSQRKTGQGAGQSPAIEPQREALGSSRTPSVEREAVALDAVGPDLLDQDSIQQLISFFEMLDRWDREAHAN